MAVAPVGIINAGNPAQAFQDGMDIAGLNVEGVNQDAAATVAAGVAAALTPGATVESVLGAMTTYSSDLMRRGIELTMDLAYASKDIDTFAEKFYAQMLDWTFPQRNRHWRKENHYSGNSLEFVPAAMAIFYLTGGDANEGMVEGASFGRDCDTIASIIGNWAGALQGANAIRKHWIDTVEKANADFFEELEGDRRANFYVTAERLVKAVKNELKAAQARATSIEQILTM